LPRTYSLGRRLQHQSSMIDKAENGEIRGKLNWYLYNLYP
jgi:hypothetical protein